MSSFTLTEQENGLTLAAVLRSHASLTWSSARTLCESGKVFRGERPLLDPALRVHTGWEISVRKTAKRPLSDWALRAVESIVYEDSQVVVIDKPAGLQSVPYDKGDRSEGPTAMDLIREAWRHAPKTGSPRGGRSATDVALHIVHRIDKETSGLLLFAKTKSALRTLQLRWRHHDIERRYVCVVHGLLLDRSIQSYFIQNRGDGLRGSLRGSWTELGADAPIQKREPAVLDDEHLFDDDNDGDDDHSDSDHRRDRARDRHQDAPQGKRAVTHLRAKEFIARLATVCEVSLETGKTHQIRIHVAESGHPVVGEEVYIRDFVRYGGEPLPCPRLLLHAETLGFAHPVTGKMISLNRPPPAPFLQAVGRLRAQARQQSNLLVHDKTPTR